jgi:hypothetical protein
LVPVVDPTTLKRQAFGELDAYYLFQLYGAQQLRAALSRYPLKSLKEALKEVERRNPGTKPKSRSSADDVIDYIVDKVAGPGY